MSQVVTTKGAPRDLGFDQGCAVRDQIREGIRLHQRACREQGSRGFFRGSTRIDQVRRDVARFFPHHAERIAGLARGAKLSVSQLNAVLASEFGCSAGGATSGVLGLQLGVLAERAGGETPLLAKSIEVGLQMRRPLIARRTLPDNGYSSIELTYPEHPGALAGVNECGLAMVVSSPSNERTDLRPVAAPAMLLGQDCLLRFDLVEKALDWCMTRPMGGRVDFIFADVTGSVVGIEVDGKERTVRISSDGTVFGAPEHPRYRVIKNESQKFDSLGVGGLADLLSSHGEQGRGDAHAPCRHGAWAETSGAVIVDPGARTLRWTTQTPCRTRLEEYSVAKL